MTTVPMESPAAFCIWAVRRASVPPLLVSTETERPPQAATASAMADIIRTTPVVADKKRFLGLMRRTSEVTMSKHNKKARASYSGCPRP